MQPPNKLTHLPHCQPNPTSHQPSGLSFLASSLQATDIQSGVEASLNWLLLPGYEAANHKTKKQTLVLKISAMFEVSEKYPALVLWNTLVLERRNS